MVSLLFATDFKIDEDYSIFRFLPRTLSKPTPRIGVKYWIKGSSYFRQSIRLIPHILGQIFEGIG